MDLGDSLARQALTTGMRVTPAAAPPGITRLAVTLPDGSIQHFERATAGGPEDWRATDFESTGGGCAFNEPITSQWGCGLDAFTPVTAR
ncbi:hypothetical protein [Streptomyces halobius]|uniref:Uncharacterized protein n=1 Tax=Streptomyces halobius TaxID=2879846 RepID=A0ABY4M8Q6_9ACTN|nr:hypothetical protein [Streptomyces halobius]UQA93787.1 hypothetical protein K9S39_19650 [Streptomyces halobius]